MLTYGVTALCIQAGVLALVLWIVPPRKAFMASLAALAVPLLMSLLANWRLNIREAGLRGQVFFTVFMVLCLTEFFAMTPGVMRYSWGLMIPIACMVTSLGFQVTWHGYKKRRVGDSLHCPKCDYELGGPQPGAPPQCPECGTHWRARWIRGARTPSPLIGGAGVAIALLGASLLASKFTGLGKYSMGVLPTPALTSIAANDTWGNNKDAWAELAKRTLTAEQTVSLVTKLLDLRLRDGRIHGQSAAWLEATLSNPAVPPELVTRYYGEWFEPRVLVPAQTMSSASFRVMLGSAARRTESSLWMYIWVHDIRVDGQSIAGQGFQDAKRWFFELDFENELRESRETSPSAPSWPVASRLTRGPHEVEIVGYLCASPRGTLHKAATLDEHGRPTRPPTAAYFQEFTARKSITVGS